MPVLLVSPHQHVSITCKPENASVLTNQRDITNAHKTHPASIIRKPEDPFDLFGGAAAAEEDDDESKCKWLRSQIIGADAEFESPFGCRRITYLDHTASGRFLHVVENYLQREVLPFYGNTHTVDSHVGLHTSNLVRHATQTIKRCMGAGPHDVLLFCGSGCTAAIKRLQEVMGITVPPILRSTVLGCIPPSDRWIVFVGPYEHHSNILSWRESLAQVVEIGLNESGLMDLDALASALGSPEYSGRPKLGSFSACSNVTGIFTDTRAVARVLHEHGAFACFDFACSGPYVEIDVKLGDLNGYDAVFLSPHKFLGGPGSPGILLMSPDLYGLRDTPPSTSGGGTVVYVNNSEDTVYCEDVEEREDAGTPAILQKVRAALAFRVKEHVGHVLTREREAALSRRALERLQENPRVRLLGNTCADRLPIVSFLLYPEGSRGKHLHGRFVTRLLNDLFGIQARGGCMCAGPYGHVLLGISRAHAKAIKSAVEEGYEGVKPGWTRVSFGYYAPREEMEFGLDAIEFIAQYGHHFLALYDFDWKTGNWHSSNDRDIITVLPIQEGSSATRESYLGTARRIAESLPSQPLERKLPEYIDPELVTFWT